MVSPKGFFWFIHYLFCYVTAVFWTSTVSSSVLLRHYAFYSWFPTFYCFIICLLRHCCVLGLDCLFFCLLRDYAFSSWYPLSHYQLLRHYAISSRFPLFHYLFVTGFQAGHSTALFVTSLFSPCIQAMTVAPLQVNYYSEAFQTQWQ